MLLVVGQESGLARGSRLVTTRGYPAMGRATTWTLAVTEASIWCAGEIIEAYDEVSTGSDEEEAFVNGDREFGVSSLAPEEGAIVDPPGVGVTGAAIFSASLPCLDDWTIGVRGLDDGFDDSFFVDVQGTFGSPCCSTSIAMAAAFS